MSAPKKHHIQRCISENHEVTSINVQQNDCCKTPTPKTSPIEPLLLEHLPAELVARILYFLFLQSNNSLNHIVAFISTNKLFYSKYSFLLYTLKPLTLTSEQDGPGLNSHQLTSFLNNQDVAHNIVSMAIIYNWKDDDSLSKRKIFLGKLLRRGRANNIDKILMDNFFIFDRLASLTLRTDTIHCFRFLDHRSPRTLQNLKIIILGYRSARFNIANKNQILNYIHNVAKSAFSLRTFEISSDSPIVPTMVHSIFCWRMMDRHMNLEDFLTNYFNSRAVRLYEEINLTLKMGLIWFGYLLYSILDRSRDTLKLASFERIDISLVFNKRFPENYNYRFPILRMFVFDMTSFMYLHDWVFLFQNLNIRQRASSGGLPLYFFIHHTLGGVLLGRPCHRSAPNQHFRWLMLDRPLFQLKVMRRILGVDE